MVNHIHICIRVDACLKIHPIDIVVHPPVPKSLARFHPRPVSFSRLTQEIDQFACEHCSIIVPWEYAHDPPGEDTTCIAFHDIVIAVHRISLIVPVHHFVSGRILGPFQGEAVMAGTQEKAGIVVEIGIGKEQMAVFRICHKRAH